MKPSFRLNPFETMLLVPDRSVDGISDGRRLKWSEHTINITGRSGLRDGALVGDTKTFFGVSGKDSIGALLNVVGGVGNHVSILIQGHHDESFELFTAMELKSLLDAMVEVLLHVVVSKARL
jgi:hypothetical protein